MPWLTGQFGRFLCANRYRCVPRGPVPLDHGPLQLTGNPLCFPVRAGNQHLNLKLLAVFVDQPACVVVPTAIALTVEVVQPLGQPVFDIDARAYEHVLAVEGQAKEPEQAVELMGLLS